MLYFQFSLRDQASNWLERLPAGSITTWKDLTTRFFAQFFPPGRIVKLCNDILTFQQHHGESLSKAWTRLSPQSQALETTFEARVRDYMTAHTERMERFENIFKQREGINNRMTEMFRLLKELTTSRTLRREEERSNKTEVTPDNTEKPTETETKMLVKEAEMKNGAKNGTGNKSIKTHENEEAVEAPGSQPVTYYLKHKINEKLIKGLADNNIFNNSLSGTRVGKKKGKTYKVLPRGSIYEAILKKKITKKEEIRGNFEIPCNIRGQKGINALVDQGSDSESCPTHPILNLPTKGLLRLTLDFY
ncbi:MAK10-like protein [Tanacetum coccineum]